MNKRGDTTVFQELVKAIPAVLLVLILVYAGVKIYNATHPEKYSTEKKDLLRIVNEIKDLKVKDDSVIVPVFSKNYTLIVTETVKPEQKTAFTDCNLDYCACFKKGVVPIICETFNLRKEYMIGKETCPFESGGGDYKGFAFSPTKEASTDKSIKITREGPCQISITNS